MDEETDDKAKNNLFLDKKVLTAMIVDKEGQLNGSMGQYLDKKAKGYITEYREKDCGSFNDSWRLIYELYSFMKHNKLKELKKKHKDLLEQLTKCISKYEDSKELTHRDLIKSFDGITKFISLAGYHEDKFKDKSGDLEDEENY